MGNSKSIGSAYLDQDISAATTLNAVTIQPTGSLAHGEDGTDLLGFYGITPIAQRDYTASLHLSSTLSSSTTFSTAHLAAVNEIQATFVALGIWATA